MSFKIVGIGEVLWDLLPSGRQMGGAPANFACHAQALGADARVISRVGNDDLGREIIRRLDSLRVPTYCVFDINLRAPFCSGELIEKLLALANEVAAYVCTCSGATPPVPPKLRGHFQSSLLGCWTEQQAQASPDSPGSGPGTGSP